MPVITANRGTNLKGKVNFIALISVDGANPNGDPCSENMPRTDMQGYGEISSECVKRKIRNRLQDAGENILVKADDRIDDGFYSVHARVKANGELQKLRDEFKKKKDSDKKNPDVPSLRMEDLYRAIACKEWIDVRTFGQLFAFEGDSLSCSVTGPLTILPIKSVVPVTITDLKIVKSTNGSDKEEKSSDRMGNKYYVDHGLYVMYGSICVQPAEITGLSQEDVEKVKQAILTMFEGDTSAARPDGSMNVCRLYWWQHKEKTPRTSTKKINESLHITPKVDEPKCFGDYEVVLDEIDGCVKPEVYDLM